MNEDIIRNINDVRDGEDIEIVVDQCSVFYRQIQIEGNRFYIDLRAQGDSLKGACNAKSSKFDFEKYGVIGYTWCI